MDGIFWSLACVYFDRFRTATNSGSTREPLEDIIQIMDGQHFTYTGV
jgi:hypothetical protein